jgi:hypothetical protein
MPNFFIAAYRASECAPHYDCSCLPNCHFPGAAGNRRLFEKRVTVAAILCIERYFVYRFHFPLPFRLRRSAASRTARLTNYPPISIRGGEAELG